MTESKIGKSQKRPQFDLVSRDRGGEVASQVSSGVARSGLVPKYIFQLVTKAENRDQLRKCPLVIH